MNKTANLDRLSRTRILVVGDIMLDRYEYGSVERISPEAPVPVFRPSRQKTMLGGVGNVAANLAALGCKVDILSRTGKDKDGALVAKMATAIGAKASLIRQNDLTTIVKTRLIAGNNHLLRIDNEIVRDLDKKLFDQAADTCLGIIEKVDIVLLSDYAKGMLTTRLCKAIIDKCRKCGKKVIVDPKGTDYTKYKGAFLVKPNLKELSLATGISFNPSSPDFLADVTNAARSLAKKIGTNGILVTLSEHGMLYAPASASAKSLHLPTKAKEVFDVSGAGDTALAALGAALGAGLEMSESMQIANAASSVVVSKLGTATASINEIGSAMSESPISSMEKKIVSMDAISEVAKRLRRDGKIIGFTNGCFDCCRLSKRLRRDGKIIGFTNGCFDCCHLGHLSSIQQTKALCDMLIVGVNSDNWIRKHKGPGRPIQDQKTRTSLLASLEFVDYVVIFDDTTALPLVKRIRPDVIAKEGYSIENWPEGQFVRSVGGKAITLKRVPGYSTTAILKKANHQT